MARVGWALPRLRAVHVHVQGCRHRRHLTTARAPIPVVLDCDPGHDDAMAIVLAGHSERLEVLGVSTVAGNMPVAETTRNALRTLHVSGLGHLPVAAGAARPLIRPPLSCPEIHGETGLDGYEFPPLPAHMRPVSGKAVLHMAEWILGSPRPVTLIATGCLTNVALLLSIFPECRDNLSDIVIMGGAIGLGNTGPVAEFNMEVDPDAAKMVFDSGLVTMVPLEVTHTALVTDEILARVRALDSEFGRMVESLLTFFAHTYSAVFDFAHPPLHDPVAVAYVINPQLFESKSFQVDVERHSALSYGQTLVDYHSLGRLSDAPTVNVAMAVDVAGFWDLMFDALRAANRLSVLNADAAHEARLARSAPR